MCTTYAGLSIVPFGMYLHGFEKRIFPDHSKWSSMGEREMNRQSLNHWSIVSADYFQPIKRLIMSTELFSVLTEWASLFITHCIMQLAMMIL